MVKAPNIHIKILAFMFFFGLFIPELFATSEFKEINKLQTVEKKQAEPKEVIIRPKVEYNAENERSPFESPVIEDYKTTIIIQGENKNMPVNLPTLKMQGLIWGGIFPQAIINNKVLKTGDTIEGARILVIEKDGVTLIFRDTHFRLPSPGSETTSDKKI